MVSPCVTVTEMLMFQLSFQSTLFTPDFECLLLICKFLKLEVHHVPISTCTVAPSYHLVCFSSDVTRYIASFMWGNSYRQVMWAILLTARESLFLKRRSSYANLRQYETSENFHKGVQSKTYFQLFIKVTLGYLTGDLSLKFPRLKQSIQATVNNHRDQLRLLSFKEIRNNLKKFKEILTKVLSGRSDNGHRECLRSVLLSTKCYSEVKLSHFQTKEVSIISLSNFDYT